MRSAGHVIVAVAPSAAARLMPEELEKQREFFDSVIYSPFTMPIFFLDRPLSKDVWSYFGDPKAKRTFQFALDEHAKVPEMSPSGKAIVTAWSGHPMTLDLMDLPDDEIIEKARQDLELILPGFSGWIEDTAMVRHSFGIARYPVGAYRRVLDFLDEAKRLEGVSFASDLFGGCYMEAAMGTAADAVRRVCGWGGTA